MRAARFILAILVHLMMGLAAYGGLLPDCLQTYRVADGYYALQGWDYGSPSTAFRVAHVRNYLVLYGSGVASYVEYRNWGCNCSFVQVEDGETISLTKLQSATKYFQRVHMFCDGNDWVASDYSIKVDQYGGMVHLGFLVNTWDGYPLAIGWVSLDVSENSIWVEKSAIDTDCGDLVVGEDIGGYPADGGTWQKDVYVDAGKSGNGWGYTWGSAWESIQKGIWALREQNSTIHVKPGVYGGISLIDIPCFEPIGETHLVIESTDGPSVTFIDGGGYGVDANGSVTGGTWCVSCGNESISPHVTLRGFTLRNGLGGARGVECLENCVIENCHYGLSNTYTRACSLFNVHSPLAPASGVPATISSTSTGFRVAPDSSHSSLSGLMLLGTPSLAARNWTATENFSDTAFMRTNRFFTIGIRR